MGKIKNKKTIIILSVLLLVVIGVTIAYFSNSDIFDNIFNTKPYGSTYTEEFVSPDNWLPGDTTEKNVIATNSGSVDQAVRIKISEKWLSYNNQELSLDKDGVTAALINLDNSREWIKDGDYYYYKYKIAPNESTSSFIKSVTFNPDITLDNTCTETQTSTGKKVTCSSSGNDYDNAKYTLTFNIETVQYNQYKKAWNTNVVIEPDRNNLLYEFVANNGEKYTGNGSDKYTNDVYFLTENTNNNVMFADHCWKIVRTTDTGGVKLLYNGKKKEEVNYEYDKLSDTDLLNITNDETYPYSYNSSTKEWSSTNLVKGSTSTFTFSVPDNGEYVIDANVLGVYDFVKIYKGEENLAFIRGKEIIDLGFIDSSNIIKVEVKKHQYATPQETDKVSFIIGKVTNVERSYTCNNSGAETIIGNSKYNENSNSPADVGYMYNKIYELKRNDIGDGIICVGNAIYENGIYKLTNISTLDYNHRYTCGSSSVECDKVKYFVSYRCEYGPGCSYAYIELDGTKNSETALGEMLSDDDVNENDSTIKTFIDNWYEENMIEYTDFLEDTIFCNDRSIDSLEEGWQTIGEDKNYWGNSIKFKENKVSSDLTCSNKVDRFTVSKNIGNGALTYPIGLLSSPEANLWGENARNNNYYYWLGSPNSFYVDAPEINYVAYDKDINSKDQYGEYYLSYANYEGGVRPSISLAPATKYASGDGTVNSPFIIPTE